MTHCTLFYRANRWMWFCSLFVLFSSVHAFDREPFEATVLPFIENHCLDCKAEQPETWLGGLQTNCF